MKTSLRRPKGFTMSRLLMEWLLGPRFLKLRIAELPTTALVPTWAKLFQESSNKAPLATDKAIGTANGAGTTRVAVLDKTEVEEETDSTMVSRELERSTRLHQLVWNLPLLNMGRRCSRRCSLERCTAGVVTVGCGPLLTALLPMLDRLGGLLGERKEETVLRHLSLPQLQLLIKQ